MLELFKQNVIDVNFIEMFIRSLFINFKVLLSQIDLDYFITVIKVIACMDLLLLLLNYFYIR